MLILGIESSCDETAAAVVRDGRDILSNIIASQIEIHQVYGGVVPEIASRCHLEAISPVVDRALGEAGVTLDDIDAIAVTYGPGLVGALLIGVSYGKALASAAKKPLVPVHHIAGHIAANTLVHEDLKPPYICLVASGGHSHIVEVTGMGMKDYHILGRTRDDAAGEAFDKVARLLGLGYPGGPKVDKLAKEGDPQAFHFPRVSFSDNPYDFSFSGVKTAVMNMLHQKEQKNEAYNKADVAASFQQAVVDVLSDKVMEAAKHKSAKAVALAGGVAANSALRHALSKKAEEAGIACYLPPAILCTDNAAMIAAAGYHQFLLGETGETSLNAVPNLSF